MKKRKKVPPDPQIPRIQDLYSPEGVDLTLIRWMLSLTPAQRLHTLESHLRAVLRIRARNART